MKKMIILAMASLLVANSQVFADKGDKESTDIKKVRAELSKMIPAANTADIESTKAENVYQLSFGGNFAYAYVSGDYVLIGDLYNSVTKENLGEMAQAKYLDDHEDKMIVFGPKDAERYITVFTDIDCGYCRKLHQEVAALNEAGVQVRYLAFPRAGVGSASYDKYVSVWCSDDQQKAMTDAKAGRSVGDAKCENPITDSYNIGREFGVNGTPTIVFDNGGRAPGYMPADRLLTAMGVATQSSSEDGAE
ncbi:MAG: DsbC family protein [Acidiferrobacterales bacterium]|nr:DsbC family protein [Acidiferrobacterales bacterium]